MKVRLLRSVATAQKVYTAGAEVWVDDALAERWQAEGIAVVVEVEGKHREGPPATKAVEGPVETKRDQGQEPEQPVKEAAVGEYVPGTAPAEGSAAAGDASEPVEGTVEAQAEEDGAAGVSEDAAAGDAGGGEGGAAKPRQRRRAG